MQLSALTPVALATAGSLAGRILEGFTNLPRFSLSTQTDSNAPDSTTDSSNAVTGPALSEMGQLAKREALQRQSDALLEQFREMLSERLTARGIDTSLRLGLKQDGQGGMIEFDGHPDRAAIEQLLREDSELARKFQQLAETLGRLDRFQQTAQAGLTAGSATGQLSVTMADHRLEYRFEA